MSYRDHYSDTLHDLVDAEARHDRDPRELEHDRPTRQEAKEDARSQRPPRPSHEVAEDVRRALDASGDLF